MKRRLALYVVGLIGATLGASLEMTSFSPAPGRSEGRIYYGVPSGIDRAKPAPLLVFLHGGDARSPDTAPENYFKPDGWAMPVFAENLGGNRFRVETRAVKAFRIYLAAPMGDVTRPFTVETADGVRAVCQPESVTGERDYSAAITIHLKERENRL